MRRTSDFQLLNFSEISQPCIRRILDLHGPGLPLLFRKPIYIQVSSNGNWGTIQLYKGSDMFRNRWQSVQESRRPYLLSTSVSKYHFLLHEKSGGVLSVISAFSREGTSRYWCLISNGKRHQWEGPASQWRQPEGPDCKSIKSLQTIKGKLTLSNRDDCTPSNVSYQADMTWRPHRQGTYAISKASNLWRSAIVSVSFSLPDSSQANVTYLGSDFYASKCSFEPDSIAGAFQSDWVERQKN